MALAHYNFVIQDDDGNKVDGATVSVTRESSGALAPLYSDEDGATPLGNPFIAIDGADAGFYVVGGKYRIDVVKDGLTTPPKRNVLIGTAQGADLPFVGLVTREINVAGDVTILPSDARVIINKTVGAATNVILPPAAERVGADVEIIDGKGDAASNNITPVFDGSELCNGQAGAFYAIKSNFGSVRFVPKPDGSGWTLPAGGGLST